jgi:dTDP-4-amino-4,6-dideoxygalactose transaminase
MKVPYIDLAAQHLAIRDDLLKTVEEVLMSGQYILGKYVSDFEQQFAKIAGTSYSIGVANGTDALVLAMKALGIGKGDEVITAPNSFLASASSIALVGARPVFADVREDLNINPDFIESVITLHTRAIIPVHLTGRPAAMNEITDIARKSGIHVIEDAAQAIGAEYHQRRVGSLSAAGCFSLHPLKNLSACGDGGMITTSDEDLLKKIQMLRNHGLKNRDECITWSLNSRLDALQAAIVSEKLKYIDSWTHRRRYLASLYREELQDVVKVPVEPDYEKAVYHTFIIQAERRDQLKDYLLAHGIDTKVHYPIPIHLQEAAAYLGYTKGAFPVAERLATTILSLPIFPELSDAQVQYVIEKIREFYH